MKIILVAGARPNFMKIAPIIRAVDKFNAEISEHEILSRKNTINTVLVHTGQHYDHNMSKTFFDGLGIRTPEYHLDSREASAILQITKIMAELEKICSKEKPDMVLVVGDVNSTVAAALVAKKLNIKLAHVEAGLRSLDRAMPEEINRIVTDAIADILFTTEPQATENLLKEGHDRTKVHFAGHVMIDNLYYQMNNKNVKISNRIVDLKECLFPGNYICLTMHRPSNVDNEEKLGRLLSIINDLSLEYHIPVIFSCHPRTKQRLEDFNLFQLVKIYDPSCFENSKKHDRKSGIYVLDSLDYNDFLYLWKDSTLVITDSGGLQEETTAIGVPCFTVRDNTERPITCETGTNIIVGDNADLMKSNISLILNKSWKKGNVPDLWDGKAAERIVNTIAADFFKSTQGC